MCQKDTKDLEVTPSPDITIVRCASCIDVSERQPRSDKRTPTPDINIMCRCQCERTATKQMSIRQLPAVLCLHMKRFKATDKGATQKVDSAVSFPVAHLDMAPFTSAPVLANRYRLTGLLSHPTAGMANDRYGLSCYSLTCCVSSMM